MTGQDSGVPPLSNAGTISREEIPASPSRQSVKRQRNTDSPISISSSPARNSFRRSKSRRDKLFDGLEAGDDYPAAEMTIASAEDLSEAQLKKCFEILHACGSATDPNASLSTTRQSIDGFLDAIFNDWSSRKPGNLMRSELEFLVEADVVAGKVCVLQSHRCILDCISSDLCTTDVTAVATYSNNPPMFKMEFTIMDPFNNQPETFCPIARGDIHWVTTDWVQELRKALQAKIVAKIHKFNKHLAIWQARKLILEWAKGGLGMGEDVNDMGFLGRGTANVAIIGLGKDD
ncbi:hypothetical protein PT974_06517 [Cladobotryum mycophilum]|uniref:Uncharacterized protein n=1 Tax=Cladobotryum mycophilum TaxID=491253 RepID=A0ABR0SLU8_9HYPO